MRALEATCHTPVGVLVAATARVRAFVGLPDGSEWIVEEADDRGRAPQRLLAAGAVELLRAVSA